MSIRLDNVTSRGRFNKGSFALGTRMAWIGLGDRDKLIEDLFDSSINANPYWMADQNGNLFIDLKPRPIPIDVFTPLEIPAGH